MITCLVGLLSLFSLAASCGANEEYASYLAEWKAKCPPLLEQWRKPESAGDAGLRGALLEAAVRSEQPGIVEEIAAGGDAASLEIKLPSDGENIQAQSVRAFDGIPSVPYGQRRDCVIRRMTKSRFELWTPKRGRLFDAKGKLLNEALPPRRDGIGREWHGAFLPDGSWITTDLWEMDKTLTLFSRAGKMLQEIKVSDLAPAGPDEPWSLNLIGWARCDKEGEGWVLSVGDGFGRAIVFVKPRGKPHRLEDSFAPWKLCYPRDLEPKGMFTGMSRPSDDYKRWIRFSCPSHGMWVGFPSFSWSDKDGDGKNIPEGDHNFGFLPGSHDVFIGASDYDNGEDGKPRRMKTWFFAGDGKCLGWTRAAYLCDSADGASTWYCAEDGSVAVLDAGLKPQSRLRFLIDGQPARPVKLFTDLQLGFFNVNKQLVLASW
ncbi:MAG: hypothetical protein WCH98_12065 [Verrucomicrobiota bacterium]